MQLLLVMIKIMAYIDDLSHPEILILNTKGRIKYKDRYPI